MTPPASLSPAPNPPDDDEDDYMSMAIAEPSKQEKETSIQRRARKQREAEIKARTKPKAEREADEAAAREAALATKLDPSNKGAQMMAKLGFKGGALGKANPDARTEPINVLVKEDRGGIGLDSEKKRKVTEDMEHEAKRVKAEEGDYRERVRREREEKRIEGQIIGAQKVAERLDTEAEEAVHTGIDESEGVAGEHEGSIDGLSHNGNANGVSTKAQKKAKPLRSINLLWRGVARHRAERERENRMRYDLHQSLSRLPTYDDPDEDKEYKQAFGKEEEEVEEEDLELDEFNMLDPIERLNRLVMYLREAHRYCFWCKFQHPDTSMEGCPGITEEDHD
ncbi:hypothetical protein B0A49_11354 [Cryomyces minteri]|uniref:G-patch domain-containing protein n=1 Tax=Cryomyces minteri TaxID=331657 RepID=A0A4U0W6K7_9PEZI|nr:hypothetical protein B0A49_11354 [Cryomyces minteri]